MKRYNNSGFTLIELLVVITILAIISVVAYQNFGGAVDKAVGGRKISDVSTIEAALQQYKSDFNYYPSIDVFDPAGGLWGYSGSTATASNKIGVTYIGQEINTLNLVTSIGGGRIFGSGTLSTVQIGAKGTIGRNTLGKKYLTKDLYDPEVGDLKIKSTSKKMIDHGVGRYVYSIYNKGTSGNWANIKTGINYNIAYTVRQDGTDKYVSKIVGDYDKESCYTDAPNCPDSLIGTATSYLIDGQLIGLTRTGATIASFTTVSDLQGIPYPVTNFN